jgi:hypothetical protein
MGVVDGGCCRVYFGDLGILGVGELMIRCQLVVVVVVSEGPSSGYRFILQCGSFMGMAYFTFNHIYYF